MSEERHIRIRIGVLIVSNGKLLLIEHIKNGRTYWLIPGGGLEYGETIANCARREMKEETNLDVSISRFLFSSESIAPDGSRHILNMFFLGKIDGDSPMKIGDEERLKSLAFFPIDDLDKIEFHPPIGHIVKNMLKSEVVEEIISANRHLGNFWKNFPTL